MTNFTFAEKAPTTFVRRLITNTSVFESTLVRAIQTAVRGGEHWELDLTWQNLNGDQYSDVYGFFMRLNGGEHRTLLKTYGHTQRGAYGGTPVVDLAGQTGKVLNIRNASIGITDWAKRGDIISFDNQARMVTDDANSDGSGDVALDIIPAIRASPADATTVNVTGDETGIFILDNMVEYKHDARRRKGDGDDLGSLALKFVEDVNA